ncbi:hypothetical protein [Mycobacteroides abscessus]|uniref:hypothetical protein n=1 Tax=Mycobacteroides abscessus TaxID=36809 RepID=UPI000927574D|nr:hypothetical protein [Mycobacteroides abscessus]DAZ90309.1 TPA_asm: hypothetical protein PROPHIFSQJ01-1_23 [Mycobacterium phage prophiFSQJ01-1]SII40507.1 Uncharacterised protein [Mycobacteroides abscessus subsp. abscessus]SIK14740.1 Uncharacterised protein [Mycobacteroides abscessus subsp. abscessus]SIN25045.1 Uncharacterised protein [Mycobacteroides abscessus subsp. abscessus]SLI51882.1 Uncharacterised protein [Mycobacteroides abscessus subsp. abscessus]
MSELTNRVREVARMVIADAEDDVQRFNGKRLTGDLVGEIQGCTNGLIFGLASCIENLADEIDRLDQPKQP